jgi:DNA/RNA-binding domain of Phe-tRNA-synthetase-like protein
VVYTDAAGVLTRHWNHRDADRTKVTEDSEWIVFLLETVDATAFGATMDAATDGLTALLRYRSPSVTVYRITTADPAALVATTPHRVR